MATPLDMHAAHIAAGTPSPACQTCADMRTGKTVDLTPTDEGFANIARVFADQILADVKRGRLEADRHLLENLLEIVAYLAAVDPQLVVELRRHINPVVTVATLARKEA